MTLFVVAILPTIIAGVKEIIDDIPTYADRFETWISDFTGSINPELTAQIEEVVNNLFTDLYQLLTRLDYTSIGGAVTNVVSVSFTIVMRFFFGIVVSIYFLMRKEGGIRHVKSMLFAIFSEERANRIMELAGEIHRIFMNFFVSKILQSFVLFIIGLMVLIPLRIPLAPLIALVIAITNMIPYFGPYIGGPDLYFRC